MDLSPLGLGALALTQAGAGVTEPAFFASEGLSLHFQKMERSKTLFSLTSPITETSQRCKDMSGSGGRERGARERHPHARYHYDGCSAEGGGCILGTLGLEGPVPFLKLQN